MELRDYIKLLRKNILILALFSLGGILLAFVFAQNMPSGPRQEQSFFLSAHMENKDTYHFEGFYAQETARNFTDTAVAILSSPDFTGQFLEKGQSLKATKVAPQIVRLAAGGPNAQNLISSAVTGLNLKLNTISSGQESISLKPLSEKSQTVYPTFSKKIILVFGATIGLVFAILAVGLQVYFKL